MTTLELMVKKALIRLTVFCKKIGELKTAKRLEGMLGENITAENKEALIAAADSALEEFCRGDELPRIFRLLQKSHQTPLGEVIFEFALARLYFPEIGGIISSVFHPTDQFTMEDVLKILGQPISLEQNYGYLKETYEQLAKVIVLPDMDELFFRREMKVDRRLFSWLCMEDELEKDLAQMVEFYFFEEEEVQLFTQKEIADTIFAALGDPENVIQIAGEKKAGRKYLLKSACKKARRNLLFVNFKTLLKACQSSEFEEKIPEDLDRYLIRIKREMLLYDMGICFWGLEELSETESLTKILFYCMEQMLDQPWPVCIITNEKMHLIDRTDVYVTKIVLPSLTRSQRKALWDGYCSDYGLRHIDTKMAAQKYRLNAGEIQKAAYRIYKSGNTESGKAGARHLAQICEEVLPSPIAGQIQLNKTKMGIDDLKVPTQQKQLLSEICAQVNFRQQVFDEWGMEEKYPYGKNISALFIGPPGTGKTMAVDIISGLINLPVYKIDLSQVVDKYIGETEKKLEEVFNLAQKSNTILFFDEADSIFGKRSEVNEAKDRYANTEVSYILQRIEQYDGVVILASNFKKNIDEAFLRRMRYLVEFPMPDAATRKEIWKSCFGSKVPTEDLDFSYLAKNFEFSGGSIKNIALNAVFLAAKEGCDVGMKQVLTSLRNEKMKMGKPMILSDFGQYAGLMMEGEFR